ncbi:OsmC family protein [Micromonospora sp. NBC_01796]|uniref:OsmC family protein n=1 Tax=Micromonospora sp. NBC_01796 TaxID=2975987 RepID=UPI002DD7AE77|nr:OsmC family protein [Micromonospora sp. NBC_01796]WSA86258.1 OsmC family protein [Micromonospora sp. NBC_01796]
MPRTSHRYPLTLTWTGDRGSGTADYRAYGRSHEVTGPGLPPLLGSADPTFRGEADRWNPEQLLVAALSQCHLLAYLHVCAVAGVVVTGYVDQPEGVLTRTSGGGGHFTEVVLRPRVTVAAADQVDRARELHREANRQCFIANSVNFPVRHEPVILLS